MVNINNSTLGSNVFWYSLNQKPIRASAGFMIWWCHLLQHWRRRINRKLAAKVIYLICSTNFELLVLIAETLNFSPLSGKVWLNSIPKALTEKFNKNKELFNELKQFIESSSLIESKGSSFWTFPEFKSTPGQDTSPKHLSFPDPKYYMIGFSVDKNEESENIWSDWDTTHTKTNDTLKQSITKKSSPLDIPEMKDLNKRNISMNIHKPVLHPIDPKHK